LLGYEGKKDLVKALDSSTTLTTILLESSQRNINYITTRNIETIKQAILTFIHNQENVDQASQATLASLLVDQRLWHCDTELLTQHLGPEIVKKLQYYLKRQYTDNMWKIAGICKSFDKDSSLSKLPQEVLSRINSYIKPGDIKPSDKVQGRTKAQNTETASLSENFTGKGIAYYEESSYWYEYSKVAMQNMLELRLKNTGADIEDVRVVHPKYVFTEEAPQAFIQDLAAQIRATGVGVDSGNASIPTMLIPMNINNQHWVGMTVEFADDKAIVTYMDSEGASMPESLRGGLKAELARSYPASTIEIVEKEVELQKYNNCGLEVIENLIAAVAGEAARIEQEDVLEAHSILYEQSLILEGAWKESKNQEQGVIALKEMQLEKKELGAMSVVWDEFQIQNTEPMQGLPEVIQQRAIEPKEQRTSVEQPPAQIGLKGQAEKAVTSMAKKIVTSAAETLRMLMYVDPHDVQEVLHSTASRGGCATQSGSDSLEVREALSQSRCVNLGNSTGLFREAANEDHRKICGSIEAYFAGSNDSGYGNSQNILEAKANYTLVPLGMLNDIEPGNS
jgi:hypothetical protein